MKKIAIIGSALSGGAGQIIEVLSNSSEQSPAFILDNSNEAQGQEVMGVNVLGSSEDIVSKWNDNLFDEAIIAIGGNLLERKRLFDFMMEQSIPMANIIDSSVKMGINSKIGVGNVILNNCYFGNSSVVGNNNYFLNQSSVQHDSTIGDHNYFATNVTLGAKVKVGNLNRLGIKAVIETHGKIGNETNLRTLEVINKI